IEDFHDVAVRSALVEVNIGAVFRATHFKDDYHAEDVRIFVTVECLSDFHLTILKPQPRVRQAELSESLSLCLAQAVRPVFFEPAPLIRNLLALRAPLAVFWRVVPVHVDAVNRHSFWPLAEVCDKVLESVIEIQPSRANHDSSSAVVVVTAVRLHK